MKIFSLLTLAHVTHQFSLRNFGDIPQELLTEVGDDIDAEIIDIDSINEVFTQQLDKITSDKNTTNASSNADGEEANEDEESNLRRKQDDDECPMDRSEIFQMKLY